MIGRSFVALAGILLAAVMGGFGRTPTVIALDSAVTWDNPTAGCAAGVTPILAVSSSPNLGTLFPDNVVPQGTAVQLAARAYVETTAPDCSVRDRPMALTWALTYRSPGADEMDATTSLANTDQPESGFVATTAGMYTVRLVATPPATAPTVPAPDPVVLRVQVTTPTGGWVSLGPDGRDLSATGRVNAVAIDATRNIIYAGADRGGVWKSVDNGASWYAVTDNRGFNTLAIGALAVDPRTGVLYAGTGDPYGNGPAGDGIYVSPDQGATWSLGVTNFCTGTAVLLNFGTTRKIVVDSRTNPSRVYAVHSNGLYERNPDGCWTRLNGLPLGNVTDLIATYISAPTGTALGQLPELVAAVPGQGAFASTDFRAASPTWTPTLLEPAGFCQSSCDERIALASNGTLYSVFAQGPRNNPVLQLWRTTPSGPQQLSLQYVDYRNGRTGTMGCWGNPCPYNLNLTVNPANPQEVYFATVPTWRSRDGGLTWSDESGFGAGATHGDVHDMLWDPRNPAMLYQGDDGGISVTNASQSRLQWSTQNVDLAIGEFYTLATSPAQAGALAVGAQDNGTQQRTGGRQWASVVGGDGGWVAFDAGDPGLLYYNPDGFGTSNIVSTRSGGAVLGTAQAFWADPLRPGVLLAVRAGQLYITTSAGGTSPATWRCIDPTPDDGSDTIQRLTVSRSTAYPAYWLGMTNGNIYRVRVPSLPITTGSPCLRQTGTDAAAVPPVFSPSAAGAGITAINDIVEDPRTPCVFLAATSSPRPQERYLRLGNTANDCSAAMTPQYIAGTTGGHTLPASLQAMTVQGDPQIPGVVYAGTDSGLYAGRLDHGAYLWNRVREFPQVPVTALAVRQNRSIVAGVYAATYGRGVWQRVLPDTSLDSLTGAPSHERDLTVTGCHPMPLDEHRLEAGKLALVQVDYLNNTADPLILHLAVTSHGHTQPHFATEHQELAHGAHSAFLLVKYAGSHAPLDLNTEGVEIMVRQEGHEETRLVAHCEFQAHWWRADAALLRVSAVMHQHEAGSANVHVPVSIKVGDGHVMHRLTPFEVAVPRSAHVTLEAAERAQGHGHVDFAVWGIDGRHRTKHRSLTFVPHTDRALVAYYIEPAEREHHRE